MCEKCNAVRSVSFNMVVEMESGAQEVPLRAIATPAENGTVFNICAEAAQITYIAGFLKDIIPVLMKAVAEQLPDADEGKSKLTRRIKHTLHA